MSMRLIGVDPYGVPCPGSMCRNDEEGGSGGGGGDIASEQSAAFAEEQAALNEAVASGNFGDQGGGSFESFQPAPAVQRETLQAPQGFGQGPPPGQGIQNFPGVPSVDVAPAPVGFQGTEQEASFYAPQTAAGQPGSSGALGRIGSAALGLGFGGASGQLARDIYNQGPSALAPTGQNAGILNVVAGGLPNFMGTLANEAETAGLSVQRGTEALAPTTEGDSRELVGPIAQSVQRFRGPATAAPTVAAGAQPTFIWDPQLGRWVANPAATQPAAQVGGTTVAQANAGGSTVEQATGSPQPLGTRAGLVPGSRAGQPMTDPNVMRFTSVAEQDQYRQLYEANGGVWPAETASGTVGGGTGATGGFAGGIDPALYAPGAAFGSDMSGSLQAKQLQIADAVLNNMYKQAVFQDQQFADLYGLQRDEDIIGARAYEQASALQPFVNAFTQQGFDLTSGGFRASPEDISLINEATSSALQAGVGDIEDFELAAMRNVRDIVAPAQGLRGQTTLPRGGSGEIGLVDSPVVSQLGTIGESALRQKADLANRLRSAQLSEILNFPVTRGAALSTAIGQQNQLAQAAAGQQYNLRNQAVQNRLALTGTTGQLGLGLTSGQMPNLSGTIGALLGAQTQSGIAANQLAFQRQQAEPSFADRLGGILDIGSGITGLIDGIKELF